MAETILVGPELERGEQLLQALDAAGVKLSVALWARLAEYGDWRLIMSSRQLDIEGTRAGYRLVYAGAQAHGMTLDQLPSLAILKMNDSFIRGLRKMYGKSKSVLGLRLGGQLFGDRFIEDGYAYRIR